MNNRQSVTAVFDIGKTNKKFFLFDEDFRVLRQTLVRLDLTTDDDGDPCEDLMALEAWIKQNIQQIREDSSLSVKAVNCSAYGASLVHLDETGKPVTPLYDYLKPYPEELQNTFYTKYKGKEELSVKTASPPMGMLNSGLQLYWLKYEKPEVFKKIRTSLHFPQYLSYLISGQPASEFTSIGCHTAMWDFTQNEYHQWIAQEKLFGLLPEIKSVTTTCQVPWNDKILIAGIGIHDSSAALIPYLYALDEPFMLVSTGTWSITFNPFNKQPLTFDELQRDCLCNMDMHGNQIKTSRFFLGNEYRIQNEKLRRHFNVQEKWFSDDPDPVLIRSIIQNDDPSRKLQLETAYNSGPFPQNEPGVWDISQFGSYKDAYHQLMLDLVSIQAESIKLTGGESSPKKLIVTGGFSQNDFYLQLLASFFPDKEIYTSNVPNASALGAALVVNDDSRLHNDKDKANQLLSLRKHKAQTVPEVMNYRWKEAISR